MTFKHVDLEDFFMPKSGYIGIGTDAIQVGDQVVLFSGPQFTIIVCSADGSPMHLVGAAHLDGMMNGVLWPDGGDDSTEIFYRLAKEDMQR